MPVLAGGGLAAALAFGTQGVWLGTRFIATEDALAHENYKAKIVEINEAGTVVTRAHSGKPNVSWLWRGPAAQTPHRSNGQTDRPAADDRLQAGAV